MSLPERIATLALNTFNSLPERCKPRIHPDGRREWTPMSAIVLTVQHPTKDSDSVTTGSPDPSSNDTPLLCVSLATGTKCLPATLIPQCAGQILHDSHAEILALRGLNRWLLNEMALLVRDEAYVSPVLAKKKSFVDNKIDTDAWSSPAFEIRTGVEVYMFSTTAPCGDASMELLMRTCTDATPWEDDMSSLPLPVVVTSQSAGTNSGDLAEAAEIAPIAAPPGRGYFSRLGTMRRKPARGDAPVTMSKSCSDKLALKQFTGVLGFPVDLLVSGTGGGGVFLKGLIVYEDQFDAVGYQRAFGRDGRLRIVTAGDGDGDEKGKFFDVHVLPKGFTRFEFEKKLEIGAGAGNDGGGSKATNISAVYVAGSGAKSGSDLTSPVYEVIVGGVKQGFKQSTDKPAKGSVLCRKNVTKGAVQIWEALRRPRSFALNTPNMRYSDLKDVMDCKRRHQVKRDVVSKLGGWISNSREDDFDVHSEGVHTDSAVTHR